MIKDGDTAHSAFLEDSEGGVFVFELFGRGGTKRHDFAVWVI